MSHTWNTRASTTTMDDTSSTTDASTAESRHSIAVNDTPVILFRLMIAWMIHVRKPRSFSTPTMIIMPTRNRMMSSSAPRTMDLSVIALQATSNATPMNATPTRRSQKRSVVEMTDENTASVRACVEFVASPASSPPNVTPHTINASSRNFGLKNFMGLTP